jgi:glycosyltransferase involved in cell wall biosynthesis
MGRGGAETQLLKTLERLPTDKFEAVIVLSREPGASYEQLAALPIVQNITVLHNANSLESQSHRGRYPILSLLRKAFRLAGIIKSVKPAIIHSWLWYSNFLCGLVRQFSLTPSGVCPLIVSQRGDYYARYSRSRLWLTEKIIYRHADVLLTNSDSIRDNLRHRYPDKRILAIRNLLDLPDAPPSSPSDEPPLWHIVSVGRLTSEKGHQYLIEALHLLNTKFNRQNFTATILGDGTLQAELVELVNHYDLSDRIQMPGFCDDIFPMLSAAHLFVLPSLHESSPNALIEAMGVGLPCIASSVGGVLDLIDHQENGLLVQPQSSEVLAEAINRLLTDWKFAVCLGKNARQRVEEVFDNNRSIQQLEAVYGDSVCMTTS